MYRYRSAVPNDAHDDTSVALLGSGVDGCIQDLLVRDEAGYLEGRHPCGESTREVDARDTQTRLKAR